MLGRIYCLSQNKSTSGSCLTSGQTYAGGNVTVGLQILGVTMDSLQADDIRVHTCEVPLRNVMI